MKKNSSVWFSIAAGILAAVILSIIVCSFLIMPAAAIPSDYKENKIPWSETLDRVRNMNAENDRRLLPQPPYVTNNPTNPGSYTGPCPIGTGGAPQLRQTGLSSGAECRGACGMDCPDERCKPLGDWPIKIEGGTCTYKNMIGCPSHQGCIDHDACYDYCSEKSGDSSVAFGHCHGLCNQRCYDEYGFVACAKWAALPGAFSTKVQRFLDYYTNPSMDVSLTFSDKPVFTPDAPKATLPITGTRYPAYLWAISSRMWNDPDCTAKIYYTDSGCSEDQFFQNKCGQIPSRCVDTSMYKNGITREFTYILMPGGNQERKADGWDITYRSDGNIQNADHFKNGEVTETCSPVISAIYNPEDTTLYCHTVLQSASVGETFTRESLSLGDP